MRNDCVAEQSRFNLDHLLPDGESPHAAPRWHQCTLPETVLAAAATLSPFVALGALLVSVSARIDAKSPKRHGDHTP